MTLIETPLSALPARWQEKRLSELIIADRNITYGVVQPGNHTPNGIPIVRVNNIHDGQFVFDDVKRVSSEVESAYSRTRLKGGEVLLSLVGSLGKCAIVPNSMAGWNIARAVALIPVDHEVGASWIKYCLKSPLLQHYIHTWATTTVQATLNLRDVKRLPIPLPPKNEREQISHILGTLDDKIELNRQMNQTIEEMARAIFKSWFVDFDPVYAKQAGENPIGMDVETADLFPNSIVESELGPLPKGWKVMALDQIAHYQNGLALQKFPPEDDEFLPVIKIRELRQGKPDGKSNKSSHNIKESCIIDDGDVIFSWSGSLLVDIWCGGKGALNQHLFKVTSAKYPRWFYYQCTKYHLSEFQRIAADKATTMGHIKRRHLAEAMVIVPPEILMQAAGDIIRPLVEKIVLNNLESRTLAELRDTLLPKLISGEVRVGEVGL